MREIKFRVWDIKYKEMLTVHQMNANDKGEFNNNPQRIPLQYTGLKDKTGKEIYEGDILTDNMVVIWSDTFASFGLRKDGWLNTHFFQEGVNPDDIEVIGNIYENPELLKNNKGV